LYGTELAESEVDLLVRQVLMGHAKPETTEVYTHLAQRKLMQTVDRANPLGKMADGPGHALANIMRRRAN
jgi:Phage integrase family.